LIADGFTAPVALISPEDGSHRLFVADQAGVIWIISEGQRIEKPFLAHLFLMRLHLLFQKKSPALTMAQARQLTGGTHHRNGAERLPDLSAVLPYRQRRNHAAIVLTANRPVPSWSEDQNVADAKSRCNTNFTNGMRCIYSNIVMFLVAKPNPDKLIFLL
jgi:hypothetical protein